MIETKDDEISRQKTQMLKKSKSVVEHGLNRGNHSPRKATIDMNSTTNTNAYSDIESTHMGSGNENTNSDKENPDICNDPFFKTIKPKARWHSFERKLVEKRYLATRCISKLSATEMTHIKSVAALRLNNILHNPDKTPAASTKRVANIFRRFFSHENKKKTLKNSLEWNLQRYGTALPPSVYAIINRIHRDGATFVGIFRKSGKKANINIIEKSLLADENELDISKYSLYDLADVTKAYFRKLSESIIPENIATLLASAHNLPPDRLMYVCQMIMLLMADENRDALYSLLYCLRKIADNAHINKMNSDNLSTCFVPVIFQLRMHNADSALNSISSNRLGSANISGNSSGADLNQLYPLYSVLQKCFAYLIDVFEDVFAAPYEVHALSRMTTLQTNIPHKLNHLGRSDLDITSNYDTYMDVNIDEFYEEHRSKYKSWSSHLNLGGIPITTRKVKDGYPLLLYRGTIDIDAKSSEVFTCYLYKGSLWRGNSERFVIKALSNRSDLFYQQYDISTLGFFNRDFTLLRKWKKLESHFILACTSIKITEKDLLNCSLQAQQRNKVLGKSSACSRGIILATRLVVEQLQNKTRVHLIHRIDLMGKRASTYKHITPYLICRELISLKEYFATGSATGVENALDEVMV